MIPMTVFFFRLDICNLMIFGIGILKITMSTITTWVVEVSVCPLVRGFWNMEKL